MSNQVVVNSQAKSIMEKGDWVKLGANAAIAGIVAVLIVEALAISLWPEIALFAPLNSYARSAIFTLVPAIIATTLFAWLVGHVDRPVRVFITISVVALLISFIPDYILPVPHKTFLASTVAAFLHVVAAAVIVPMLVLGYQRRIAAIA